MIKQTMREVIVANDRRITLTIPAMFIHRKLEVLLIPLDAEKRSWSPGFFEKTAGCFAGDEITRASQGQPEDRNSLL